MRANLDMDAVWRKRYCVINKRWLYLFPYLPEWVSIKRRNLAWLFHQAGDAISRRRDGIIVCTFWRMGMGLERSARTYFRRDES
jgi:hypothetical protein